MWVRICLSGRDEPGTFSNCRRDRETERQKDRQTDRQVRQMDKREMDSILK